MIDKMTAFLAHLTQARYSSHTIRSYQYDLALFEGTDWKKTEIVKWLASFQTKGNSTGTVLRRLHAVSSFFNWMVEFGHLKSNPCAGIKIRAGHKRHLPDCLTQAEIARMIDSGVPGKDTAILIGLWASGARLAELLSIRPSDIDGCRLRIRGKGNKDRVVPIPEDDAARWKAETGEFVFPYSQRQVRLALDRLAQKAQIGRHINPHSIRHSYAVALLENGADIRTVQKLLGHASLATTQVYLDVTDKRMDETFLKCHPRARRP